jgi:tryptophan 2,3-dioxygenase
MASDRNELTKPILPGDAATDYERYLRTDELLALQKTPEEMRHADELTFQVVHQSSELLMKGAAWELTRAKDHVEAGEYDRASRLIRRALKLLEPPISLLQVLESITPYDYHVIRSGLGHGSGLDSPGFVALLHIGPPLGESFMHQLQKQSISVDDLYRRYSEFLALHDLAEELLNFDERMQAFRFHHLKLAQRIIGGEVVGTMGTPVEILQQRMERGVLYKALWEVRNEITAKMNATMSEESKGHGRY